MMSAAENESIGDGAEMTIVDRRENEQGESSFDRLFESYADLVYRYALRRVGLPAAAEDIAAEVFAEVFRQPGRVSSHSPRAWLLAVARRKIADYYRKDAARRAVPLTDDVPAVENSGFAALIQGERQQQLRLLVGSLPADQREALLLFYVEGLSPAEISVTLRRSRFAVNSLLQRARKRVYELGRDYFDEGGTKC